MRNITEAMRALKSKSVSEEFVNNITDEKAPDILYHFTSSNSVIQILRANKLDGAGNYQVSFTSDESYAGNGFQPKDRTTAVFVFDGKKLGQDYTIERYVYDLDPSAEFDDYVNEHEWVIKDRVDNILKYLLYIGDNEMDKLDLRQIQKEFPNIKIEKW